MKQETKDLITFLREYVSPNKQKKIKAVLADRTNHISIVLEDIYQPHNANATLRTCELLGVQNVHIIENRNEFALSRGVTQGSSKWLSLHKHKEGTQKALKELKKSGYQLIATTPGQESITLDEIDLKKPIAFLFGTEAEGLTEEALEEADAYLRLPMYGMTQSYNISVSVAITLSHIIDRLHRSDIDWHPSDDEKESLTLEWYKRCVKNSEKLIEKFTSS